MYVKPSLVRRRPTALSKIFKFWSQLGGLSPQSARHPLLIIFYTIEDNKESIRTLRVVDDDIEIPYKIVPDMFIFYIVVSVFVSLS